MRNRNFGLDVMRAAAIILVLLSHYAISAKSLGILGVELFFVLSGFLIGGIFLREIYSVQSYGAKQLYYFLRRRWYRTLPNFYLFLLVFCALWPFIGRTLPSDLWRYLIFFQNFAWPMPGFFVQSWSLAVEEWFYLIFPASVVILLLTTKSKKAAFSISFAMIVLISLSLRFLHSGAVDWNGGLHMVVIYRLDALMYGVFMAWVNFRRPEVFSKLRALTIPAVIMVGAMMLLANRLYTSSDQGPIAATLFTLLPIACACLLPFAYRLQPTGTHLDIAVTSLSLWSYSIYLSHPAILYAIYHFTDPLVHGIVPKFLVKVAAFTITLAVSRFTFLRFETPLMKLRDRQPKVRVLREAEMVGSSK